MILWEPEPELQKIERGVLRTFSTEYLRIQLYRRRQNRAGQAFHVSVHHRLQGWLGLGAFLYFDVAQNYFNFMVEDWAMGTRLTKADRTFMHECGIDAGPEQKLGRLDGTQRLLVKCGVDPYNRAEYIRLASAGTIDPHEVLDGEIEQMLAPGIRRDDDDDDDSDEPIHTTPAGFPICARCKHSTRDMNRLVCRPCESGTRLFLTLADRKWMRGVGVKS